MSRKHGLEQSPGLLDILAAWLTGEPRAKPLLSNEDRLERYRAELEGLKWQFAKNSQGIAFPACDEFSQHMAA